MKPVIEKIHDEKEHQHLHELADESLRERDWQREAPRVDPRFGDRLQGRHEEVRREQEQRGIEDIEADVLQRLRILRRTDAFQRESHAIDHADPLELLPGVDETVVDVLHVLRKGAIEQVQVYNIFMKFAVLRAARAAAGGSRAVYGRAGSRRSVRAARARALGAFAFRT